MTQPRKEDLVWKKTRHTSGQSPHGKITNIEYDEDGQPDVIVVWFWEDKIHEDLSFPDELGSPRESSASPTGTIWEIED